MDISYNGTAFHGWQSQKNAVSVQQTIEEALSKILRADTAIVGSGRTDTGVHARQQIAHFDSDLLETDMIIHKLNAMLPTEISINDCFQVREDAHARFDAHKRTYHYFIHARKDPFKKNLSYYFRPTLDLKKIQEACRILEGWSDFESFSKVHTDVSTFICQIYQARWTYAEEGHLFAISADRFLRGMVRAVVGTLIDVGLGKLSLEEFALIEGQRNRSAAGRAVPPGGLYLLEVEYPSSVYLHK